MKFFSRETEKYNYLNIRKKRKLKEGNRKIYAIFFSKLFVSFKKVPTFASAIEKQTQIRESKSRNAAQDGPFVYRLGRKIFILERGVRFPHGLQVKRINELKKNRLVEMANHKSSLKRIRQEETRRLHNRYYGKTMRNAVRKLRATTDKAEAVAMYPGITKMLDKLAKTNVIHKNKANNLKSKLALYINKLA